MPLDRLNRPLEDLRVSVTDRCNFRCTYCMPLDEYEWIKVARILSFEEIARLARIFTALGVRKIRLTGGEPLVRKDLPVLVRQLAAVPGVEDLAMTTNASRLVELAAPLAAAGLRRITVSLDTLQPDRFRAITQRGDLQPVLDGLFAARAAGLKPIKINVVVERGVNEDEIPDLATFGREHGFDVRFIEYMDVGNANQWRTERLAPKAEILERIRSAFPFRPAGDLRGSRPADHFEYLDGAGGFGVIASVTDPFCGDCSRARLTADGQLVTCLFSGSGFDLKPLLRGGAADAEIARAIEDVWTKRSDRYSETRLVALCSAAGYQPGAARKLEMIRLGG
jgi:cyclic pyranopterin phosphate synthase